MKYYVDLAVAVRSSILEGINKIILLMLVIGLGGPAFLVAF